MVGKRQDERKKENPGRQVVGALLFFSNLIAVEI